MSRWYGFDSAIALLLVLVCVPCGGLGVASLSNAPLLADDPTSISLYRTLAITMMVGTSGNFVGALGMIFSKSWGIWAAMFGTALCAISSIALALNPRWIAWQSWTSAGLFAVCGFYCLARVKGWTGPAPD